MVAGLVSLKSVSDAVFRSYSMLLRTLSSNHGFCSMFYDDEGDSMGL